ncbi:hypothetical protein T484DRAFT_2022157 [Baffinella frigidus]|nr:hypothetical protein T484DRAFT_2022157 [Cryptophyta sp. CCMP2293]
MAGSYEDSSSATSRWLRRGSLPSITLPPPIFPKHSPEHFPPPKRSHPLTTPAPPSLHKQRRNSTISTSATSTLLSDEDRENILLGAKNSHAAAALPAPSVARVARAARDPRDPTRVPTALGRRGSLPTSMPSGLDRRKSLPTSSCLVQKIVDHMSTSTTVLYLMDTEHTAQSHDVGSWVTEAARRHLPLPFHRRGARSSRFLAASSILRCRSSAGALRRVACQTQPL